MPPIWRAHHYLAAIQPATGAHGIEFCVFYGAKAGFSRPRILKLDAMPSRYLSHVVVVRVCSIPLAAKCPRSFLSGPRAVISGPSSAPPCLRYWG